MEEDSIGASSEGLRLLLNAESYTPAAFVWAAVEADRWRVEAVWLSWESRLVATALAAAALARTSTTRIGLPFDIADNVFWLARRVGTLAHLGKGRVDVLVRATGELRPSHLLGLFFLKRLWQDSELQEQCGLRPGGSTDVRMWLIGQSAESIAQQIGVPWSGDELTFPARDERRVRTVLTDTRPTSDEEGTRNGE